MNEQLAKQLIRQIKILNFWVTLFGSLFLITLIIAGFLLWQLVSFINQTNEKLDAIKSQTTDSLNIKKQTCEADNSFSDFIKNNTRACN